VPDLSAATAREWGTGAVPVVGAEAPDFELSDQYGQPVRLSDLRGRRVLVVFFPHAFSPTCTGELGAIRDGALPADVLTLGISCDPSDALKAFAAAQGIEHPLLSDFWPHGEVSRAYGVFFEPRGFAIRGTFLVDEAGILRWRVVNGPGDPRSPADYQAALAGLDQA
jgi:mycoredoxin-dependent peroxiredoxin